MACKETIENRPEMECILLEYLITKFYGKNGIIDKTLTNHKIFNITYSKIIGGEYCYDVICESTYKNVKHKSQICIYETSIKEIERKHKINKIQKIIK